MNKKVLVPLVMICILAVSTLIISCGPIKSVEVNANSDMLKTLDNSDIDTYIAWEEARKNKDFESADKLRMELINKGVL